MKGKRSCFACGRKTLKGIRLHRFPKDPLVYSKWKLFCIQFLPTLRDEDEMLNCYICNEHFEDDCFKGTKKQVLKNYAVPTVISRKFDNPQYRNVASTQRCPNVDFKIELPSELHLENSSWPSQSHTISTYSHNSPLSEEINIFNIKKEIHDESDDAQNQGDGENFGTHQGKVEDVDICKQFVDKNGIHERREYLVKEEDSNLSEQNSLQYLHNERRISEMEEKNISDIKEEIHDESDDAQYLENSGGFCTHQGKVEDLDISEQFVDKDGIHEREEYLAKEKDDNSSELKYAMNAKQHKCHQCDYVASRKSNVKLHIAYVHLNLKPHKCNQCDYAANRKSHLKMHIDSVHLNYKQHKCHLCKYATNIRNDLRKHIDHVHLNIKPHECHLCEYATNIKTNLKKHIDSFHLNLKPHKCHLCEYATNLKSDLKKHIESVHLNLKPHKCHQCDYAANRKSNLIIHIDSVHLNLKPHKCHLCEYATKEKRDLKKHIDYVHLNLKPHKCHLCEYATNIKRDLKNHMDYVHLNLKPHKCHLCEYAINSKYKLKRHIDSVHLNL